MRRLSIDSSDRMREMTRMTLVVTMMNIFMRLLIVLVGAVASGVKNKTAVLAGRKKPDVIARMVNMNRPQLMTMASVALQRSGRIATQRATIANMMHLQWLTMASVTLQRAGLIALRRSAS